MKEISEIYQYDEDFIKDFATHFLPIYDLWSIRPLINTPKRLIAGKSEDIETFEEFITEHSLRKYLLT